MTAINITASVADTIATADSSISFTPTSATGNIYVNVLPPKPDLAVGVFITASEYELGIGMEDERETTMLIKVRTATTGQGSTLVGKIADTLHTHRDGATWNTVEGGTVKVIRVDTTGGVLYEYDDNNLPVFLLSTTIRWVQP